MDAYQRFYKLLSNYPSLVKFWNTESDSADLEAIRNSGYLSSGEQIILNCLVDIWTGGAQDENMVKISDLTRLDETSRQPLITWLQDPFFP